MAEAPKEGRCALLKETSVARPWTAGDPLEATALRALATWTGEDLHKMAMLKTTGTATDRARARVRVLVVRRHETTSAPHQEA